MYNKNKVLLLLSLIFFASQIVCSEKESLEGFLAVIIHGENNKEIEVDLQIQGGKTIGDKDAKGIEKKVYSFVMACSYDSSM